MSWGSSRRRRKKWRRKPLKGLKTEPETTPPVRRRRAGESIRRTPYNRTIAISPRDDGQLPPSPGHRRDQRSVGRDDPGIWHVQRVWGRRPRLDANSSVFHVIDDPIFAVG